jgi:hypothetical protein
MSDLRELKNILTALQKDAKAAKIYIVGKHESEFRNGHILVSARGTCNVSYFRKEADAALQEIGQVSIEKLMVLPLLGEDAGSEVIGPQTMRLDELIEKLQLLVDAPANDLIVGVASSSISSASAHRHSAGQPDAASSISSSFNAVDAMYLMQSCRSLLEKYYGSGATKKVDEVSISFPPQSRPTEFLQECRKLLIVMAGQGKAEKLFSPLFEKIR